VGQFSSGEEAVAALPKLRPQVVIMDVNLPGMDGVACVRALAGKLPDSQILMLTVRQDTDVIFNALAAGASGYLLKPARAAELLAAVRDVSAGGAPMSGFIARQVVQSFQARPAPSAASENLSAREVEVLELLSAGFAYKEIADRLGIAYGTVHTHVARIYKKLHVQSRGQAVARYRGNE
jgi:DNA-binding NarL/FixJ family response regulator